MSVLNSPENRDLSPHISVCVLSSSPAIVSALENDAAGNPYRIFFNHSLFLAYVHPFVFCYFREKQIYNSCVVEIGTRN